MPTDRPSRARPSGLRATLATPLARTVLAAVVASAIGIAIGLTIHWFPVQASAQSRRTDTLYYVLVIVSVPIFVLVVTVILYCVWQFRVRPGQELQDGPPIHGNTRLEIIWTAAPAVLIIGLVSYALIVLHNNEAKGAGGELQVKVTGQQFAWSYEYPASGGGATVRSDVLYLPEGQSVNFKMTSLDVIHAFWVPAFRLQQDVVPGVTTSYRATPTRTGVYDVVCNELCGLGHTVMRTSVHVVAQAQFQAWLKGKQGKTAPSGAAG